MILEREQVKGGNVLTLTVCNGVYKLLNTVDGSTVEMWSTTDKGRAIATFKAIVTLQNK